MESCFFMFNVVYLGKEMLIFLRGKCWSWGEAEVLISEDFIWLDFDLSYFFFYKLLKFLQHSELLLIVFCT